MTDDLLGICRRAFDAAKQQGATEIEVYAESGTTVGSSIEQNEIKGASSAEFSGVGIRVRKGRGIGFAFANRTDDKTLAKSAEDACAIALHGREDHALGMADPGPLPDVDGLHDDAVAALGPAQVTTLAAEMLAAATQDDARIRADGGVDASRMAYAVKNSLGLEAQTHETFVSYGLYGMAKDGDNIGALDEMYRGTSRADAVAPEETGRLFREKVIRHLDPVAAPSTVSTVVFSHDAFSDVFLSALTDALDGEERLKKKSRFTEHDGSPIAAPILTLTDDGRKPAGAGSSRFDREGRAHQPFVLVDAGHLGGFLYDGRTARRANTAPTGHAGGSARGAPYISSTNLIVQRGATSERDLIAGAALYVGRLAGRVDAVSGDFSGVAKNSFLIENGERTRPVTETLIAGNVYTLLHRIAAVGDTHHGEFGLFCPWVRVDGVTITGGNLDVAS